MLKYSPPQFTMNRIFRRRPVRFFLLERELIVALKIHRIVYWLHPLLLGYSVTRRDVTARAWQQNVPRPYEGRNSHVENGLHVQGNPSRQKQKKQDELLFYASQQLKFYNGKPL